MNIDNLIKKLNYIKSKGNEINVECNGVVDEAFEFIDDEFKVYRSLEFKIKFVDPIMCDKSQLNFMLKGNKNEIN
jgi:hypothetical protein